MSSTPVSLLQRGLSHGYAVFWPIVDQFAWPLSQVVLAPVLLARMGADAYGLWLLGLSFIFAAPVLSFGRSLPLLVLIPRLHARSQASAWLLQRVLRRIGWTAPVLLALALLGGWLWPRTLAIGPGQLALFILLTVSMLTVTETDNAFAYALKAQGGFRSAALCEVGGRAIQVAACLWLVGTGSSVFMLMFVSLACMITKAVLKAAMLTKSTDRPTAAPIDGPSNAAVAREMSQLGGWHCVQVASGLIFFGYDRWLVGYMAGTAALAAYGICSQYVQLGHSLAAAASLPLMPWVSRRLQDDGGVADAARVRRAAWTAGVLSTLPILLAGALAVPVLSLWIGPAFAHANQPLVERLALVFALLALSIPFTNMLIALRHGRFAALLSVAAGAALLLASWLRPPGDAVAMASLKLIFVAVVLISIWKLLQCLRTPSR